MVLIAVRRRGSAGRFRLYFLTPMFLPGVRINDPFAADTDNFVEVVTVLSLGIELVILGAELDVPLLGPEVELELGLVQGASSCGSTPVMELDIVAVLGMELLPPFFSDDDDVLEEEGDVASFTAANNLKPYSRRCSILLDLFALLINFAYLAAIRAAACAAAVSAISLLATDLLLF